MYIYIYIYDNCTPQLSISASVFGPSQMSPFLLQFPGGGVTYHNGPLYACSPLTVGMSVRLSIYPSHLRTFL
jgi:hypothetical protein